jgi:hypothetical protein
MNGTAIPPTVVGWGNTYLSLAAKLVIETADLERQKNHEAGARASAAIFMAAAALETLIEEATFIFGERGELAFSQICTIRRVKLPRRYRELATELGKNRGVKLSGISGEPYEKAHCVWQCRNHLIHYDPRRHPPGTWPVKLKTYSEKNWLPRLGNEHWTSRLPTEEVVNRLVRFTREFLIWFDQQCPFPSPIRDQAPFTS